MNEQKPENITLWLFCMLGLLGLAFLAFNDLFSTHITWTEAKAKIEAGNVSLAELKGGKVLLHLKNPESPAEGMQTSTILETVYIPEDEQFIPLLEEHQVSLRAHPPSSCESGSGWISTLLIIGVLIYFMQRNQRMGNASNPIAKSTANLAVKSESNIRFTDVAGIDEAIEELEELVGFLKEPQRYTALGGKIPKGVLLIGPPGTGKTLLAKAVAGEADVPFFHTSGSDFVEVYVGVGAARVRDLFKQAKEQAPCIIFIDELDAVGKSRSGTGLQGNDEREQTLNQLLVAMDGFNSQNGVIIMSATNRPESLDPALLRAGRFDRQISVDRPDLRGREAILKVHASEVKLAEQIDLLDVAKMTPGLSGADLANCLNEAALLAARQDKRAIDLEDIEEAIERTIAGLEKKSRRLDPEEKRIVAYHECGHALCAAASKHSDPVQKISIIPRGASALGYTMQTPEQDRFLYSKNQLLSRLVTLYGGRIAESLIFNEVTSGAADDIQRATTLARKMVYELGMSDKIGPIAYEKEQGQYGIGSYQQTRSTSRQMETLLEEEFRAILKSAEAEAKKILTHNLNLLHDMAQALLMEESLKGAQLDHFLNRAANQSYESDFWDSKTDI